MLGIGAMLSVGTSPEFSLVIQNITLFLILYSTTVAVLFVLIYHVRASWWKSVTGLSIMTLWGVISAVFVLSSVRQFVDADNLFFLLFRLTIFASVPVVLTWHLVLLIKAQNKAERERKK